MLHYEILREKEIIDIDNRH